MVFANEWARVTGANQHHFGGKRQRAVGAGDGHHAILDRLTHDLENAGMKFG
jgi:hypothetical protein